MADQASIFGNDPSQTGSDQTPTPSQTPSTPAPDKDSPLAILVGEGRKYKTIEDLAKAYINLDGFAEKLKGENAGLRDKLVGAKTVDDVIQRLQQSDASTSDRGAEKGTLPSADAIAQIVRQTVTGLETERSRNANLLKADSAMKQMFGDKAQEVFGKGADTPEKRAALMQLASVDPDQFVKLFSPAAAPGTQTDSGSTVNTAALADVNASGRAADPATHEFYEALRKKDPRSYYSSNVQLAMHRAAQANPEKYFGRKL